MGFLQRNFATLSPSLAKRHACIDFAVFWVCTQQQLENEACLDEVLRRRDLVCRALDLKPFS